MSKLHSILYMYIVYVLQTFGIILTIGMRALINRISVVSANITVSAALLVGTVITGNN
jgi:FLVCR family feline leukemia virus subgroup C receptor-related protein